MEMDSMYTLITGASKGLGKELAFECAKRSQNLILVALPNENLTAIADKISTNFNIEVVAYEIDLTKTKELNHLTHNIFEKYNVNTLINNAGIGGTMPFTESEIHYLENIILLNIRAMVMLIRKMIPMLKQHEQAFILNVASMASFGPMPYKTVYPASKAFVYSFSRGLYAELKGTNIFVSVVHPGGMATNEDVSRRINSYGKLIRMTILSPEKVAAITIRQLLKKDGLILPGFMNKISWLFLNYVPVWLRLHIFRITMKKEMNATNCKYA